MTFYDSLNVVPTTNAEAFYIFKETMKLAGWAVVASSDGTTYNSSGDQITGFASGAGGMDNNNAWFILQQPVLDGYQRWIGIQITGTPKYQIKLKLFWTLPTSGSASAMNTSADEQYLYGSSGGFTSFLYTVNNQIISNIRCGDADEKYHFYWFTTRVSTPGIGSLFYMDYVENTHDLDFDKYVYYANGASSYPLSSIDSFSVNTNTIFNYSPQYAGLWCWIRKTFSNEGFVRCAISHLGDHTNSGNTAVGGMGVNPYDGAVNQLPAFIVKSYDASITNSLYDIKGELRNIKISSATIPTSSTLSVSTSKDKILAGPTILKWDGSTPVV